MVEAIALVVSVQASQLVGIVVDTNNSGASVASNRAHRPPDTAANIL